MTPNLQLPDIHQLSSDYCCNCSINAVTGLYTRLRQHEGERETMNSTIVSKAAWVLVAAVMISGCAWAQYGGGTGGTGTGATGGTYTPGSRSYGHGAAIGAAVGGAAGAGLLFYALHRRHAQVVGCVAGDGKSITADKGKKTYQLTGEPVTPNERLSVVGKKSKGDSGIDELQVVSVKKNLGQCEQSTAMAATP